MAGQVPRVLVRPQALPEQRVGQVRVRWRVGQMQMKRRLEVGQKLVWARRGERSEVTWNGVSSIPLLP